MNIQLRWDLYHAQLSEKDILKAIRHYIPPSGRKTKPKAQQRHAAEQQSTRGYTAGGLKLDCQLSASASFPHDFGGNDGEER